MTFIPSSKSLTASRPNVTSRTDGSTSTGYDLRGLDVSSFSTSAADVGASEDSVGLVCMRALKTCPAEKDHL